MKDLTEAELRHLWTYCASNRNWLESSHHAGCFYCRTIFLASEVEDWVNDESRPTALCPHCGVDSVLPDSKVPLSDDLLLQMKQHYF